MLLLMITGLFPGAAKTQKPKVYLHALLRGVEPKFFPSYKRGLSDGTGTYQCHGGLKPHRIPLHQVNDNYCDCDLAGGTDEPGTSACSMGRGFFCLNVDFQGYYIPSSHVNDGVCDCCDGSDEYNGLIVCHNRCIQIANEESEFDDVLEEELLSGVESKLEQYKVRLSILLFKTNILN